MKQAKTQWGGAVLCAALVSGIGCGSGGGGGGGSSGVPSGTSVQDLTDDQAQDLCMFLEDTVNSFEPSGEDFCRAFAASTSPDADTCEQARKACLESMEAGEVEPDEPEDFRCETAKADELESGCDVTVGEIESCYKDALEVVRSTLRGATCENAGKVEQPSLPDSCDTLRKKCPDLAIDE